MRISDWSSDVCSSDLIVAAVHDQRRLADPLQLGEAVVARAKPGLHRRELRTDCLHPGRDVLVLGAAMAPLPELLAGLAPGIRRREAEIEKGLERTVRSEERRVGKECVSKCRSRWSPYH